MPEGLPAAEMRWWGWGEDRRAHGLPEQALPFLRETFGVSGSARDPVALDRVELPPSALGEQQLAGLRAIVGGEAVRDDHRERVLHAGGKGYPDLVLMRAGTPAGAPDAVVRPASFEQLGALLAHCSEHSLAVVPFGGGTSVVGGLAPLAGAHRGVVALDLGELAGVRALDRRSATVTVGAGTRAPALEAALAAEGLTLGHFPQSYEYVTLGGCAATRSAGQASTGYGAIAEQIVGLRLCSPSGELAVAALPASAAGPSLRELIVGSEGTLGVIGEVSLRVRRAPAKRAYEGVFFESFEAGAEALRLLAGERLLPEVARLSDEAETAMSLRLAGGGAKAALGEAYLKARGYGAGCLAILGFEGELGDVAFRRRTALALVRRAGAISLGGSPGRAWLKGRFEGPYLRDELLGHGVMVETLETATQWSHLAGLRAGVAAAIQSSLTAGGTPGLVMCHISHVYETGASLYFTFLARQREGQELEQWREVKRAASEAIIAGGGTITHHHAVGVDHKPYMAAEVGEAGLRALRALAGELDPRGIMNPGKLLAISR